MPQAQSTYTQFATTTSRFARFEGQANLVITIQTGVAQLVYILSDPALSSILPAGATVIEGVSIASVPDIELSGGHLTGESGITIGNYKFVDQDRNLSKFIDDKAINNIGLNRAVIRDYELPAEAVFEDAYLIATTQAENHNWDGGYLTIETIDTQIDLDVKVFAEKTWYLNSSIAPGDLAIPLTFAPAEIAEQSFFIKHPPHYYADANENSIAYAQLVDTGEVYSYRSIVDDNGVSTHQVKQRGALGTKHLVQPINIADDTEPRNRPRVREFKYIQEEATELAYMLTTGKSFDGTRGVPDHWTPKLAADRIEKATYAQHARGLSLQFRDMRLTNFKRWLENEVLEPSLSMLLVNRFDRLEWSRRPLALPDAAATVEFDRDNTVGKPGKYDHIKTGIKPTLVASYDYDPINKAFRNVLSYTDVGSLQKNKVNDELVLAYKGIHPSIHTAAELYRFLGVRGEAVFQETQSFAVTAMPSEAGHRPGDVVYTDFPSVSDDASGTGQAPGLARAFTIINSRYSRKDRTTRYQLEGASSQGLTLFQGVAQHNIPFEEYIRDAIHIEDVAGVSITAGVISGTPSLSLKEKYVYWNRTNLGLGLRSDDNWRPTFFDFGPKFRFWVFGPYLHGGIHDTSGRGPHRGGAGGTLGNPRGRPGERGYFGRSLAGGAIIRSPHYVNLSTSDNNYDYRDLGRDELQTRAAVFQPAGEVSAVPDLPLSLNDGQLRGIPADLSGSGGAGTDGNWEVQKVFNPGDGSSVENTQYFPGQGGARGAAGQEIVSWGGAVVGNGAFILNGADAALASPERLRHAELSRPGPGCPAAHVWISDGNHTLPSTDESNVTAFPGRAEVAGRLMNREPVTIADSPRRSYFRGIAYRNYARVCSRVMRAPAAEVVQDRPAEGLQGALEQLFDKNAQIRVVDDDTPPSNANPGDYWIRRVDATDLTNDKPPMQKLGATGWLDVDWQSGDVLASAVLQNWRSHRAPGIIGGYTRPEKYVIGTVWFDYNTGNQFILGATPDDDQPVFNRHDTGEAINPDAFIGEQLDGGNSWSFGKDRFMLPQSVRPTIVPPLGPPTLTILERGQNGRLIGGTVTNVENGAVITITGLGQIYTATVSNSTWSTSIPASEDGNTGVVIVASVVNSEGSGVQGAAVYTPDVIGVAAGEFDIAITSIAARVVRGTNGPGWIGRAIFFDVPARATSQGHPNPGSLIPVTSVNLDASGNWVLIMPGTNDSFNGYLLRGFISLADGSMGTPTNQFQYTIT